MRDNKYLTESGSFIRPARSAGWWDTEHVRWPASFGRNRKSDQVVAPNPAPPLVRDLPAQATSDIKDSEEKWLAKRGHLFSFFGLFLFTVVLYFRPYELFPSLASYSSIAYWIAVATLLVFVPSQLVLEGNFTTRTRETNLLLILTAAALLSIPLAISPTEAWVEFNESFLKVVIMFIVMINVVRTEGRLRALLFLSVGVGCVLGMLAINDFRSGNLTVEGYRIQGAIGGMFANPNDMALYLVTMTPISVALLFACRNVIGKSIFAASTVLLVAGNMLTYSRGGFLGLLAVAAVMAWKFGRRNRLLIAGLSSVVAICFVALAPGGYGKRLLSIFIPSLDAVGSSDARKELLYKSLAVAARHPLFGIGMNNFHIVSIHEQVSHNAYTQVAAELGLAALVAYVLFMVYPISRLSRIETSALDGGKEDKRFFYLSIGLQAAIIGYMVSSFFASVAYLWYVYYLVGFAIAFRRIYGIQMSSRTDV
jgi:putative inorganic carbon (HCO3(-)) transporter